MSKFFIGKNDLGKTHVLEMLTVTPRIKKDGQYTKYAYDIRHDGQLKEFEATKGFNDALSARDTKAGETIAVVRTGTGTDTRWEISATRDFVPDAPTPRSPDEPSRNLEEEPRRKRGLSLEQAIKDFHNLKQRVSQLGVGGADLAAATLYAYFAGAEFHDDDTGAEKGDTPDEGKRTAIMRDWVHEVLNKAGIIEADHDFLMQELSGGAIEYVDRMTLEDGAWLAENTKNGKDVSAIKEAYDRLGQKGLPF